MTMISPQQQLPELDFQLLDKELDRTKTRIFLGKNAAFLGPLMGTSNFHWDTKIPTAATDGVRVLWNPYYFYYLGQKQRDSILVHELKHIALMHMLRRGTRDPRVWNAACDTILDNQMDYDGYCVDSSLFPKELYPDGAKTFVNHAYDNMSAEEIYDDMMAKAIKIPLNVAGDLIEPEPGDITTAHQILNNVVSAVHSAKLHGGAGNIPGEVEKILSKFLAPKLPWKRLLHDFFNELDNKDYSWSRPNRRYSSMYLPGLVDDREGLDHLIYFEDVSGSISEKDAIRFNSEFKHVKDTFKPEKMTLVQFDTRIQKVDVFEKDDPFDEVKIVGGGGTSLVCVRDYIIEHEPTAVVIFSDMQVEPMEPLPANRLVPIIWVSINNPGARVPHGTVINLRE